MADIIQCHVTASELFLNSILGSDSDADIGVCNEIIGSFGKKTTQQRLKILKTLIEYLLEQDLYFMSIKQLILSLFRLQFHIKLFLSQ